MQSHDSYDVVYIGNYTKDTIVTPAGIRYVDGGGSRYAAYAATRLGLKVAVVTHLSREDAHIVEDLQRVGIGSIATFTPQSTLMRLEYPTNDPDIRSLKVTGVAGAITAGEIEPLEMKAAVVGSSLRGEVGLDVFRALKKKQVRVASDMQGFVRVLHDQELKYAPWDEMAATLAMVDVVKSDAVEAEFLTGEKDIFKAAHFYASLGPQEIVLTHRDGLLVLADGKFYEFGFYPANLSGRSGRGDTCVGTYVAMRLSKPPREAGMWAAAVTSLKMEKLGPFDRPLEDVEALIYARYNHGSVK